jgi:transmembrane sensor
VTLINGSIAVASSGAKPAKLTPGQRLDATPGQPIRVSTVGIEGALAWRTGYQQFSDEPLEKAISQINRYGGAPARIVDPSIRMVRVSGQFRAGDPTRFARTLAEIYPLRLVDRADGGVDIARR